MSSINFQEEKKKNQADDYESLRQEEMRRRVEQAKDYDELFETVKRAVEYGIGRHRAGLALVLTDMPNTVGAYHPVGSNCIVLNQSLIGAMRAVVKGRAEVNSFVFMVLMHEYLHSLGFLDEGLVRKKCREISKLALGPDHVSARMAVGNWLEMYPQLSMVVSSRHRSAPDEFERVDKFDSSSMNYIG